MSIDAAFRATLAGDFESARRHLAAAQVMEFALKPWGPTRPARDALGNEIVYRDSDGGRYVVTEVQSDGAHVRILMGDVRYTGAFTHFEVRAATATAAQLLASVHAEREVLTDVRNTSSMSLSNGWVALRFVHKRGIRG